MKTTKTEQWRNDLMFLGWHLLEHHHLAKNEVWQFLTKMSFQSYDKFLKHLTEGQKLTGKFVEIKK